MWFIRKHLPPFYISSYSSKRMHDSDVVVTLNSNHKVVDTEVFSSANNNEFMHHRV